MVIMSKKTWDVNQEKKKMAINIGGGGIGAVFLFGGVLATAAFVCAFFVGKKGRSSEKDRRGSHQNPPAEINKQSEQDEANGGKKQSAVVLDQPSDVGGAKTEVELDNDTAFLVQKSTLDQKPRVEEIDGGKTGDLYDVEEAGEEILRSISPTKLEMDAVSDGSVVTEENYPLSDEKLPFAPPNIKLENGVEFRLNKEDVCNEISKEIENLEQVCIEEERAERETYDNGEMKGMRHEEATGTVEMQPIQEENIEVCCDQEEMIDVNVEEDNGVEGVHIDRVEVQDNANTEVNTEQQESKDFGSDNESIGIEGTNVDLVAIRFKLSENDRSLISVSGSHSEDGLKASVPVFESTVIIEHENVEGDEKERALPIENVGIIQEGDEANEESQEVQVKYIEEESVEEKEERDQSDEGIVPIEVKEDRIPRENKEENRGFEVPMLKQERIFQEDVVVVKDDGTKQEKAKGLEANEEKTSMQLVNGQLENEEEDGDDEENIAEEIKEELIFHEDVEVVKEEIASEKVAESAEMNENKTLMQFVGDQSKVGEDDFKRNIGEEVEYSLTGKNDPVMEMSEDEENGEDNIKDFDDDDDEEETALSDEVEEISEGSGDSSMESNSEAVYPVDSPHETTVEPQEMKLLHQEVEGKIQEDKAINKDDSQFVIGEDSVTSTLLKMKSLIEAFTDKYVAKNRRTYSTRQRMLIGTLYSTRQRMLIGTLCVLSSLSCSWFFGLSSVELCLIVFLTMVLSTMVTSRQDRKTEKI